MDEDTDVGVDNRRRLGNRRGASNNWPIRLESPREDILMSSDKSNRRGFSFFCVRSMVRVEQKESRRKIFVWRRAMVTVDELLKRVEAGKEKRRQEEEERCRQREERIIKRIPEEANRVRPLLLELVRKAADEGYLGCSFYQEVRCDTEIPPGKALIFHERLDDEEARVRRGALKVLAEELRISSSGVMVSEDERNHLGGYESAEYPCAMYTLIVRWGEVAEDRLKPYPVHGEGIWPVRS